MVARRFCPRARRLRANFASTAGQKYHMEAYSMRGATAGPVTAKVKVSIGRRAPDRLFIDRPPRARDQAQRTTPRQPHRSCSSTRSGFCCGLITQPRQQAGRSRCRRASAPPEMPPGRGRFMHHRRAAPLILMATAFREGAPATSSDQVNCAG